MSWETAIGGAFVATCLVVLAVVLISGEEEDDGTGSTSTTATTYEPPVPPEPSTSTTSTTAPPSEPEPSPSSYYPLNEAEAYVRVQGGTTVAGELPSGYDEVLIIESSENVHEQVPVEKEICGYEYDYYDEREEWKCHIETVSQDEVVEKTVYVVRGGGYAPVSYDSIPGAFAAVSGYGVEEWRQP